MCLPSGGRPFSKVLSDLALALQCGGVRGLIPPLVELRCEHMSALDATTGRAMNWRKADPNTRAVDLARWSVLNESLARVVSSELLGGEGLAVGELAELTATCVAGLVVCGGPGEAACSSFGEFEELVRATAIAILGI